jgi:MFS transporter, SP family, solute carrier family 2 (myo-inositol transporter), member 13
MTDNQKNPAVSGQAAPPTGKNGYNRFLLLVAGLGGLLYGVDVGIIAGALPYLEATFKDAATGQTLNAGQLSFIVAAVLLGSVISTLFAGALADWFGRKKMMIASGILFVASIPMIALAQSYWPLVFGRLLQGVSGGLIGVVIPLYLAECLGASNRGKGAGIFQWLLTLGIVAAALIAMYFSYQLDAVKALNDPQKFFEFQDHAWRSIFWVSLPPGCFVLALMSRRKLNCAKWKKLPPLKKRKFPPANKSRSRSCAANTSSPLCWPASFSRAIRPPA